jgi:transposase
LRGAAENVELLWLKGLGGGGRRAGWRVLRCAQDDELFVWGRTKKTMSRGLKRLLKKGAIFKRVFLIEETMRGDDGFRDELFRYGGLSERVPARHPLRRIWVLADSALTALSSDFERLYAKTGRPSIAPEQMLRALLLQMLYSVRSERMLVEQLEYNLLFRWFVGLAMSERAWDATTFTKNRERLLGGEIAQRFFAAVLQEAKRNRLLHDEQFTVDGTLIEAWASEASYREKPGPPPPKGKGSGSGGEVIKADTHESVTDPDARMYRKGLKTGWKLRHMAHAVSETGMVWWSRRRCRRARRRPSV